MIRILCFLIAFPLLAAVTVSGPSKCNQGSTCGGNYSGVGGVGPYVYSVTGVGTINASTGQYTAPATVTAKNKIFGCMLGPNNSVYNTRIDALPVSANSTVWMANIFAASLGVSMDMPITKGLSTDPTTLMYFFYSTLLNGLFFHPPYFPNQRMENGTHFLGSPFVTYQHVAIDHHWIGMIETPGSDCNIEEFYYFYPQGTQINNNLGDPCPLCTSQSGNPYTAMSFAVTPGGGTDAAGMKIAPILLKMSDAVAGFGVNHALRMSTNGGAINSGANVWPASANSGGNSCSTEGGRSGICFPYGSRIRLKSSFITPGFDSRCTTTGCQTAVLAVIDAYKKYGFFVADASGGGTGINAIAEAQTLDIQAAMVVLSDGGFIGWNATNFEVVDESSLQTSPTGVGTSSLWDEAKFSNGFVTPANTALIQACDSLSACGTTSVALVGVTVGVPSPVKFIWASGVPYNVQLTANVNGASNTSVTWALSPTGGDNGTITSGGLYTVAGTPSTRTITTATATSVADGTVTASVMLIIDPVGDGTLRINMGTNANYTDAASKLWRPSMISTDKSLFDNGLFVGDFGPQAWVGAGNFPTIFNTVASNAYGDLYFNVTVQPSFTYTWTGWFADRNGTANNRIMSLDIQGNTYVASVDTFQGAPFTVFSESSTATVGSTGNLNFNIRSKGIPPVTPGSCCGLTIDIYQPGQGAFLSGFTLIQVAPVAGASGGTIIGGRTIIH